jgi:hypothetical protein
MEGIKERGKERVGPRNHCQLNFNRLIPSISIFHSVQPFSNKL